MALALALAGCAGRMEPVLPRLAEQLREAIAAPRSRKGVSCPEALQVLIPCCLVSHECTIWVQLGTHLLCISLDMLHGYRGV